MTSKLLSLFKLGNLTLKNRMIMAPMTRSRAVGDGNIPPSISVNYYEQRSSAGLIISEGAQIDNLGIGYINTPGLITEEQIEGWKKITDAVHKKDGLIFAQLWHVGRVSHPAFHNGNLPIAPSAIGFNGKAFTYKGFEPIVTPRALELNEIPIIANQYARAAKNAMLAGFDGVEIHGANGYLIDQFLRSGSNHRTDIYGGNVENRIRFALEVTEAVLTEAKNVGFRTGTPQDMPYYGMKDDNPEETWSHLVKGLNKFPLTYVHLIEHHQAKNPLLPTLRSLCKHPLIINMGYDKATAEKVIDDNLADLVSFGTLFISNPDLPKRFAENATLNKPDRNKFFQGGEKGYVDYPFLNEEQINKTNNSKL